MGKSPLVLTITTAAMLCFCACQSGGAALHPVILVPGSGGNQLEGRLTAKYKPPSWLCSREVAPGCCGRGWFRLWFDPSVLLAPFTKCFAHRMTLHYDPEKDDYYNAPGVETRVPHFGSTRSLLYMDPHLKHVTAYMGPLVDSLCRIGYVDGQTLFGAPYDFRYGLAADGHPSRVGTKFLGDLRDLVERASASNGGMPVILLSHSLGGLFVLEFLRRNPPSWRRKYVRHFIALSAPWGGSVEEMLTFASGYTLGVPLVDPLIVRGEQRSSESNLWLLPNPVVFESTRPLVISSSNVSYTAKDMSQFLTDIGFPEGVGPYKSRIVPLTERLSMAAPGVPVTCIVGSGVRTPETLFYDQDRGFNGQPEVVYGDGDGTVNMVSLLGLERLWKDETGQELKVIKLPEVSHTSILKERGALEKIMEEISYLNFHDKKAIASS
ncbi:lecithin-cholesterol acyltransferase-like 1 [Punica granatum]|uniref:Lecithin-cholesterol acyltransferase-like 1 n=1 Tax=Punica granatum TaxID=22663 RepID=A0A6P8C5S0_PUNGR|nr:lecithin-cholesterol acyltransferase-like 1 [Punica granatum]